jgi:hypothetical protein
MKFKLEINIELISDSSKAYRDENVNLFRLTTYFLQNVFSNVISHFAKLYFRPTNEALDLFPWVDFTVVLELQWDIRAVDYETFLTYL